MMSQSKLRPSPPGMAASLGSLLRVLQLRPDWIVGHSAGAAIAARMCLDGHAQPQTLVSLNGAWFPPSGPAGAWYAPAARLLTLNRLVPHVLAWQASRPAVLKKLVDSTGSRIDAAGVARYAQLVARAEHVGGVLAMMAQWDLRPLLRDLGRLRPRLELLVADADGTVPPREAVWLHDRVPHSRLHHLPGLGHLAHEEDAAGVARVIEGLEPWAALPDAPD